VYFDVKEFKAYLVPIRCV